MDFPFYKGSGRSEPGLKLPVSRRRDEVRPEGYIPDDGLRAAVNVSLLLGQPLLVTGEPGTGKTQLAYSVAHGLGLDEPFKFETKSTSTARDLFYVYNSIGRFHAVHNSEASQDSIAYITYNALGSAILRAKQREEIRNLVPKGWQHADPRRSVVLIDEIDKAPRDFPNDILNEVEGMYFRIPELDNAEVRASPEMQPILIVTSNSERSLPDAFLRRCVYYHIPFPSDEKLREIVAARLGDLVLRDSDLLSDSLEILEALRAQDAMRKKPSTSELLSWLRTLHDVFHGMPNPLRGDASGILETLGALAKTQEDTEIAQEIVSQWCSRRQQKAQ